MRRFYRNPDHIAGKIPESERLTYIKQVLLEQLPPNKIVDPSTGFTLAQAIEQQTGKPYDVVMDMGARQILLPQLDRRINEVAAKVERLAKEFAIEQAQEQYGVDISGEL